MLGNEMDGVFEEENPPKIKILKKKGNRRPRIRQTYYMKF